MRALCLLSGGLDSAANLSLAKDQGIAISLAVTFDYGQRAAAEEIGAAKALCRHFQISFQVIELPWMHGFKGALTQKLLPLPRFTAPDELDDAVKTRESMAHVWVPNRNGVFLEIGAALAESEGLSTLYVGFNKEEAETFPDNSKGYVQALNEALAYSTRNKVQISSLTLDLNKSEIVRLLGPGFPYRLLWSCYSDLKRMCGVCESCARLKRALLCQEVPIDGLFIDTRF